MHLMVSVHVVAAALGDHGCGAGAGALTIRTQHGRRHRAPDGKQDGKQDQNDDSEVFHVQ
jgi:hypothetical protein